MIKKTLDKLLRHRHFWRETGYDELSELYISVMLRSISIGISGIFVPVYMHDLGYSLTAILLVMAWFFTVRFLCADLLAAYMTAKIGPKHTMVWGHFFLIFSMSLFLFLPYIAWPTFLLGAVFGIASSLYFIPFNVDFSKVKHSKHGGKEWGYVQIMDRIGIVLGPIVGGIIATVFGSQYIFLVAVVLLISSLFPLFKSAEPVRSNQVLDYRHFRVKKIKRDYISMAALGVENTLTIWLWPLFLASFVLLSSSVFAQIGALFSFSIAVSILVTYTVGKLIDKHRGRAMLRLGAILNSMIHVIRPWVASLSGIVGISVANDVVTQTYRMPYYKALYDAADSHPGFRIVYLSSMEMISSASKAFVWWFLVILSTVFDDRAVITVGMLTAAIASLLIMTEKFKALDPPKSI